MKQAERNRSKGPNSSSKKHRVYLWNQGSSWTWPSLRGRQLSSMRTRLSTSLQIWRAYCPYPSFLYNQNPQRKFRKEHKQLRKRFLWRSTWLINAYQKILRRRSSIRLLWKNSNLLSNRLRASMVPLQLWLHLWLNKKPKRVHPYSSTSKPSSIKLHHQIYVVTRHQTRTLSILHKTNTNSRLLINRRIKLRTKWMCSNSTLSIWTPSTSRTILFAIQSRTQIQTSLMMIVARMMKFPPHSKYPISSVSTSKAHYNFTSLRLRQKMASTFRICMES